MPHSQRPNLKLVKLAGVARDNWTFLDGQLPEGTGIVDFYHGAEHLESALHACYKDRALEGVSHYVTEPAARKLEKAHPGLAARLWRAQGMRIVNAKKSKYYDAALSNFESAKRCYARAELATEWDRTVSHVRSEHHRKTGFMSGFESLVAGSGPSEEPSFLERAKARWGGRHGGRQSTISPAKSTPRDST